MADSNLDGESRPVPDPTKLTTDAVEAATDQIKELFTAQLKRLEDLAAVQFNAFSDKLAVAERLRLEQKSDTSVAVTAALDAAKEAVNQQAAAFAAETAKTERNVSEQLKGIRDTFGTAIAAQVTRYDDLKDRLARLESTKLGGKEADEQRHQQNAGLYALGGFVVAVIVASIAVIGFLAALKP
jgi:phage-related protein